MCRIGSLFPRLAISLFICCTVMFFLQSKVDAQSLQTVTVGPGDTLSQIAQDHGTNMATLMQLNHLGDADHIWLGQVLQLPGHRLSGYHSSTEQLLPQNEAGVRNNDAMEWQIYVVKAGDSLSALARDYRVGLARLAEINRMSPSQKLYVGQTLNLPAGTIKGIRTDITAASPNSSTVASDTNQPVIHTVQQGEHLGLIANLYDIDPGIIERANALVNASQIYPGQRLTIPSMDGFSAQDPAADFPTTTERWIDVDLVRQQVTAYDGITPVASFLVSTGKAATPTVKGTFRIWATMPVQDMYSLSRSGYGHDEVESVEAGSVEAFPEYDYYIEDVEWVQYFHQDYAFHAAYWHNNFGTPTSRGCVNLRPEDAKWLFEWASPEVSQSGWTFLSGYNQGTIVRVR